MRFPARWMARPPWRGVIDIPRRGWPPPGRGEVGWQVLRFDALGRHR